MSRYNLRMRRKYSMRASSVNVETVPEENFFELISAAKETGGLVMKGRCLAQLSSARVVIPKPS
jgi:hypothetical protein